MDNDWLLGALCYSLVMQFVAGALAWIIIGFWVPCVILGLCRLFTGALAWIIIGFLVPCVILWFNIQSLFTLGLCS